MTADARFHAAFLLDAVDERCRELLPRVPAGVFRVRQRQVEREDAIGREAGVHVDDALIAADQQSGADEQHDRERHFRHDQRLSRARACRSDGAAPRADDEARHHAASAGNGRCEDRTARWWRPPSRP